VLIGVDNGVDGGRVDQALFGQDRLERLDPGRKRIELVVVVVIMVMVMMIVCHDGRLVLL
jgi:hypothetical protein